ncbi:uncharacterized protein Bfra_011861 [Botrytis fragariae]|uniref:Uncharacterized protein n=1 Tax=Botrytis fragariae TaxID=1964551 RepID=A0A8H6AKA7_9HELO|nr:uncharacterized protein Bfra_011861 [Botrytis fragariae]KAF5868896.1 hypothetical protein Bfra_011861 [Botrytis fragariae]
MTPSITIHDDNSITNPLDLSNFNGRSQSQLRLETPPSFNNSPSNYSSPPITPAVKAQASSYQCKREDRGKEWPKINGISFKGLMSSSGKYYC